MGEFTVRHFTVVLKVTECKKKRDDLVIHEGKQLWIPEKLGAHGNRGPEAEIPVRIGMKISGDAPTNFLNRGWYGWVVVWE